VTYSLGLGEDGKNRPVAPANSLNIPAVELCATNAPSRLVDEQVSVDADGSARRGVSRPIDRRTAL